MSKVLVIVSIIISLVSLKYFIAPYVWICLVWFIVFLYFSLKGNKSVYKFIWLCISVVVFTFGIYEGYLSLKQKKEQIKIVEVERNDKSEIKTYRIRHDILGYAPQKNNTVSYEVHDSKGLLISNIVYTIDENGLRISPSYKQDAQGCILFFGDSYTYGDNVNDNETMPYLTGLKTNQNYHIYNFGFHGYGPHQMLSALEQGLVDNIINCKPNFVIYTAIWYHIQRSAGLVDWDTHGPKYKLNKDGEAVYNGHFDDEKIVLPEILKRQFHKSLIYGKIWREYIAIKPRSINRDDEELYFSIVNQARKFIEARYPGCQFHTIYWDYEKGENYTRVIKGLQEKGIRVHLVSQINSNIFKHYERYHLSFDTHPNPLAYDIIAAYVSNKIIRDQLDGNFSTDIAR